MKESNVQTNQSYERIMWITWKPKKIINESLMNHVLTNDSCESIMCEN